MLGPDDAAVEKRGSSTVKVAASRTTCRRELAGRHEPAAELVRDPATGASLAQRAQDGVRVLVRAAAVTATGIAQAKRAGTACTGPGLRWLACDAPPPPARRAARPLRRGARLRPGRVDAARAHRPGQGARARPVRGRRSGSPRSSARRPATSRVLEGRVAAVQADLAAAETARPRHRQSAWMRRASGSPACGRGSPRCGQARRRCSSSATRRRAGPLTVVLNSARLPRVPRDGRPAAARPARGHAPARRRARRARATPPPAPRADRAGGASAARRPTPCAGGATRWRASSPACRAGATRSPGPAPPGRRLHAPRAGRRAAERALSRLLAARARAASRSPGPAGPGRPWAIVQCESGGQNLPPNGAGASGYYQFLPDTWRGLGGSTPQAYQASKAEQDRLAARLWAGGGGAHNWVCAAWSADRRPSRACGPRKEMFGVEGEPGRGPAASAGSGPAERLEREARLELPSATRRRSGSPCRRRGGASRWRAGGRSVRVLEHGRVAAGRGEPRKSFAPAGSATPPSSGRVDEPPPDRHGRVERSVSSTAPGIRPGRRPPPPSARAPRAAAARRCRSGSSSSRGRRSSARTGSRRSPRG